MLIKLYKNVSFLMQRYTINFEIDLKMIMKEKFERLHY